MDGILVQLHSHSNMIGHSLSGGLLLIHDYQTDWSPVAGGCNLLPTGLLFGGKRLTLYQICLLLELLGNSRITAGICEVRSTLSGDLIRMHLYRPYTNI